MKPQPLSHLATGLCAELTGHDTEVRGVSTDSRTIAPGELFVALAGPNFDGHAWVATAAARGACAALVAHPQPLDLPQLLVPDTRLALGRLGALARAAFRGPVIGLTGSNGKTTLKEMSAAILRRRARVLATRGNLNNDIGVPLTLLGLDEDHDCAVIEMGANHPGEIAYLTALVQPSVAILNNAGPCHLEGFGSLDGVARAKGEIFTGLGAQGVAILNADDCYFGYWRELVGARPALSFGLDAPADVSAVVLDAATQRVRLSLPQREHIEFELPLSGRHNLRNACAAAAATYALGAGAEDIAAGLASLHPVAGRLQRLAGLHGATLVNDAYNANPASLAAGLETLAAEPGEHWLVLGDMGELGAEADALHAQSGERARACGFARLYALGSRSRHAVRAFGAGGRHFDDIDSLTATLAADLAAGVAPTILVKGSRSMRMERVVRALDPHDHDPLAGAH
ncbi:MAG TPA: UDP-N-acetylmuramoyl-tripeptide--D-alanyl-D-alanine ligase [Plasticicumulans sp.]|nr:UDP-N-acetylmuramoyl-tripeptide--D-alanyl-D-alanine ligase [Plasticicumulans sp.]